jgi:hypothetical protein
MSSHNIKCFLGFPTTNTNAVTARLEGHCSTMDGSYWDSYVEWWGGLRTLHDAVDATLAGDASAAAGYVAKGKRHLVVCSEALTAFGQALVQLRSDLFERGEADASEPLLAREPFLATLDYDAIHRELAGQGAVLPGRVFWDETVARLREGGARGACRLLDRHVRELQSDLHAFGAEVDAAARLPLRLMAEALHSTSVGVGRVTTGFTRLVTTCGYVSILCERASSAYAESLQRQGERLAAG